jgi:hypothetical protein
MAGMAVTGAIIMVGAVGEAGAAGGVRASTSISDGGIPIMDTGTIRIIDMAITGPITITTTTDPTTITMDIIDLIGGITAGTAGITGVITGNERSPAF